MALGTSKWKTEGETEGSVVLTLGTDLLTGRFALAQDIVGGLIGSKAQINGMAHFPRARPLSEFHLCHKAGLPRW